jgi:hypothetical protein
LEWRSHLGEQIVKRGKRFLVWGENLSSWENTYFEKEIVKGKKRAIY